jgi:hypothetical protein
VHFVRYFKPEHIACNHAFITKYPTYGSEDQLELRRLFPLYNFSINHAGGASDTVVFGTMYVTRDADELMS